MNKWMLLALATGIISGCSSVSVNRDFDRSTDFSTLKTFAWKYAEQPQTGDPQIDNDLNDERIRNAINTTLAAKGFHSVDPAKADFRVIYFVEHQRKLSSGSMSVGMGRGSHGRYGSVGYNTGVSEYDQASLTIDVLDSAEEKMIWRGVGSRASYKGSSPEKTTRIIHEAVEKILKKFPPPPK